MSANLRQLAYKKGYLKKRDLDAIKLDKSLLNFDISIIDEKLLLANGFCKDESLFILYDIKEDAK